MILVVYYPSEYVERMLTSLVVLRSGPPGSPRRSWRLDLRSGPGVSSLFSLVRPSLITFSFLLSLVATLEYSLTSWAERNPAVDSHLNKKYSCVTGELRSVDVCNKCLVWV